VETEHGPIRARALVGADGLRSGVRRAFGLHRDDPRPPRYGARAHYRLIGPPPDEVHVHVGDAVEFYVTPTGPDEVNVAVLCGKETSRALGGDLAAGFARLVGGEPAIAALLRGAEPRSAPALVGPL